MSARVQAAALLMFVAASIAGAASLSSAPRPASFELTLGLGDSLGGPLNLHVDRPNMETCGRLHKMLNGQLKAFSIRHEITPCVEK